MNQRESERARESLREPEGARESQRENQRESHREPQRFSLALSDFLWLTLAFSLAHSGSHWLSLALSGSLSGTLWLSLALSGSLSGSLWLTLAHSGSLPDSLWLPLALSGSLWLSIALQICLPSPCSAHKALAQLGTPFLRSLTLISPYHWYRIYRQDEISNIVHMYLYYRYMCTIFESCCHLHYSILRIRCNAQYLRSTSRQNICLPYHFLCNACVQYLHTVGTNYTPCMYICT